MKSPHPIESQTAVETLEREGYGGEERIGYRAKILVVRTVKGSSVSWTALRECLEGVTVEGESGYY